MSLENKVIVITGAGFPNGIGAGIAKCFAKEKASVIITDLEGAPLDETAVAIQGDVKGLIADASSQEAMAKAADQIIKEYGAIDVLVNNAGVGDPNPPVDLQDGKLLNPDMTDEMWDMQLVANLRTAFASTSAVAAKMKDGGNIINIASIAGLRPSVTLPAYGAAKAGVIQLTKTQASQLAPRKIRVNCICPGLLWTRAWEMITAYMKENDPSLADTSQRDIFLGVVSQLTPLGDEQTPEDIGNLAVFYASDNARMITGAVVAVDGGISL